MSRTKTNRRTDREQYTRCCDWQATYIGEIDRNLSTRLTEHKRATRNRDVNNRIADHHLQSKHQIDWNSEACITYCTDYYRLQEPEEKPLEKKSPLIQRMTPRLMPLLNVRFANELTQPTKTVTSVLSEFTSLSFSIVFSLSFFD